MPEETVNPENQATQSEPSSAKPQEASETNPLDALIRTAENLGFRNPALAAKLALSEENSGAALIALAESDPYLIAPKIGPTNPAVPRSAPTLASKLLATMRKRKNRKHPR